MSVILEYWRGVAQRLTAEVDVFAALVKHHGERGRENEAALERLLSALVPRRFALGTGMVIDREDTYSKQVDLLVYDQSDEPQLLAQTTQLLFPVENVRAVVEVKSRLRTEDLRDCAEKKRALVDLRPAPTRGTSAVLPPFLVLAYDSAMSPEALSSRLHALGVDARPDLLCVLHGSVVAGTGEMLGRNGEEFTVGLALAHQDEPGVVGQWRACPSPSPVASRSYLGQDYEQDPGRALLLFVEALLRALARQDDKPVPAISHYLDDVARDLAVLGA